VERVVDAQPKASASASAPINKTLQVSLTLSSLRPTLGNTPPTEHPHPFTIAQHNYGNLSLTTYIEEIH
jgi:hypothetical protein